MRRGLLIATVIAGCCVPLLAQSFGTIAFVRMLQAQQTQLDSLQRRIDGTGELYMRVTLDVMRSDSPGAIWIKGWAYACGEDLGGRLVVVVDGVQTGQSEERNFFRTPRSDVANFPNTNLCSQLEYQSLYTHQAGFETMVDMEPFEPGYWGDHAHTLSVRVYDRYGRMAETRTRGFNTFTHDGFGSLNAHGQWVKQ